MKDKTTTAILALFLGGLGVHRFYLGQIGLGFLYLLFSWTFVPLFISFIDFIVFLAMDEKSFSNKYNKNNNHQITNFQNTTTSKNVSDEIEKLHNLKEKGILTNDEFQNKKNELLGFANEKPFERENLTESKSNYSKYFVLGFALILILFAFFYYLNNPSNYEKIIDKKVVWREPVIKEMGLIGKIMVKNNIKDCGEFYVHKKDEAEYVVACTSDGLTWNYYLVYSASEKIFLANDKMIEKFKPPINN